LSSRRVRESILRVIRSHPLLEKVARRAHGNYEMLRHSLAQHMPAVIRPRNYRITIAITARCNLRCMGCRYERDFMPGHVLSRDMVEDVLEDAGQVGFQVVRFYGGEPLLHSDLPHMVEACRQRGMKPYLTTNAVLLDRKIDELHVAGLRDITIGFYGVGESYEKYVQRSGVFQNVERGIATTREKFGDEMDMQLNWLLMRPTCTLESFRKAHEFARRYRLRMQIDLIHYSLPYFQEGPDRMLQFRPEDEPAIREVVDDLIRAKTENPGSINQTLEALRSIPDWLLKGADMRIPCTAYEMVWIGADGSVQLCYVTYELGNLNETRLKDILQSRKRSRSARDAFLLNCPNCHCGFSDRVMRHRQTCLKYRCLAGNDSGRTVDRITGTSCES